MTAEKYVREVGKLLKCRASKKRAVKRQLLSEINSAVAGGEALEDVLGRMGIPWDFANHYNDNFDRAEWRAARRERRLKTWGIVVLVIVAVFAVLYRNLPKWSDISESTVFDEGRVKARGEEIIQLYSDNEFQAVNAAMNEEMAQLLNEAMLQLTKTQLGEDFGALLAIEDMEVSVAEQGGSAYAMLQAQVSYSNIHVTYIMTFDEKMKIAGFHVK